MPRRRSALSCRRMLSALALGALALAPAAANQVMDLSRSAVPASPVYAASLYGVARLLPSTSTAAPPIRSRRCSWRLKRESSPVSPDGERRAQVGRREFWTLSVAVDPFAPSRFGVAVLPGRVYAGARNGRILVFED